MMQRLKEAYRDPLLVILFICAVGIIIFLSIRWVDNDIYTLLATGERWISSGPVRSNLFTVVPDMDIVVEQWLWCFLLDIVYKSCSTIGLSLLCTSVSISFFIACFWFFKTKKTDKYIAVIAAAFIVFLFTYKSLRPEMISVFLLVLQCIYMEKAVSGAPRWLYCLPLLTVLEINIHAPLWVLHFALLLVYCLPFFDDRKFYSTCLLPKAQKQVIITTAAMFLSLFANPYGWKMPTYILLYLDPDMKLIHIAELQKYLMVSVPGALTVGSIVLFAIVLMKRRTGSATFYCCIFFIALSCTSTKQSMFICIPYLYLLTDMDVRLTFLAHVHLNRFKRITGYTSAGAILALSIFSLIALSPWLNDVFVSYHENAIQTIKKAGGELGSAVYAGFNLGNSVEFYGYKTYIDSRPELYLSQFNKNGISILKEYSTLSDGSLTTTQYEEFLDQYAFSFCYITENDEQLMDYLESSNQWRMIYDSSVDASDNTQEIGNMLPNLRRLVYQKEESATP